MLPSRRKNQRESIPHISSDSDFNFTPFILLFLVIAAAGLFYVKWNPYYHKAFLAATKHFIGTSILSGESPTPPGPSWEAAWGYATTYFRSVWQAALLGLLLGSLVEVLLPKQWLKRVLGSTTFGSTVTAGAAAIPCMMCTCCAAPLAASLRKRSVPVGASLAYWLGNPALNPATLIFMAFILPWQFLLLRITMGILAVFGISYLANKLVKEEDVVESIQEPSETGTRGENLFIRWLRSFWSLTLDSLPIYLVMVLLLGAVRAWFFPETNPEWANSILVITGFAVAGTLFMIPTAAEIPIVATLMSFGLGVGPAAALIITLPTVSLPSLLMVRKYFPARVLVFVGSAVAVLGILSGLLATIFFSV